MGGKRIPDHLVGALRDSLDRSSNTYKFLIAIFNWAAKSKDEQGRPLLSSNPLRGLKTPTEKNPTRVVLSEEEYQALLRVSRRVNWRFHLALVLAHETGHRIGAVRQLRWSDIDLEGGIIRWRAEHEKSGYEHRTPVTPEAIEVLNAARRRNPGTGHTLVLPSPQDPSRCVGSCQARGWWQKAVIIPLTQCVNRYSRRSGAQDHASTTKVYARPLPASTQGQPVASVPGCGNSSCYALLKS